VDHRLALVANAFFVDEQQVARCTEPEFHLVVGDGPDNLDFDAVPCARAPIDDISRNDLERAPIHAADFGMRQQPRPALARLPAVLETAVGPQELYPWSRPRIVEGAGISFVEVDALCSIGSSRVGQHGVAPFPSGPWSPCPLLPLGHSPEK